MVRKFPHHNIQSSRCLAPNVKRSSARRLAISVRRSVGPGQSGRSKSPFGLSRLSPEQYWEVQKSIWAEPAEPGAILGGPKVHLGLAG